MGSEMCIRDRKEDTLQAELVTPAWFLVLGIAWLVLRRRPEHLAREATFHAELESKDPD